MTPELSILKTGIKPGLIVLRSLGKFFGLAGVRCGFVITDRELLTLLADKIGPWSVTGPSRYVAIQALKDIHWQNETRKALMYNGNKLSALLNKHGLSVEGGSALFQWLRHSNAKTLFNFFAKQGILLRLFDEKTTGVTSLRFGLPKNEKQWLVLEEVLMSIPESLKTEEENKDIVTHV